MIWNTRKEKASNHNSRKKEKASNQNSRKKKELKKNKDRLKNFGDIFKGANIQIIGVPEGEKSKELKTYLKKNDERKLP